MSAAEPKPPRRRRRIISGIALSLFGTVVFLLGTVLATVLHLGLPVAREAERGLIVALLNSTFRGTFAIQNLSRLDAFGLAAEEIKITDPEGRTVIAAERLTVDFDLLGATIRALRFFEKLSIVVDAVRIDGGQVHLSPAKGAGEDPIPSIVDAFEPRSPSTEPSEESGRSIRVWFPDVRLFRITGSSELPSVPEGTFEIARAEGRLLVTDVGVAIDLPEVQGEVREVLDEPLELFGKASFRIPGEITADLDLSSGEIQGHELISYQDGRVQADGIFADTPGEAIRRLLPEWPIDGEIAVYHHIEGTLPRLDVRATIQSGAASFQAQGRLRVSPEVEADFDLDADSVNLRLLREDWPESHLGLRSSVELWGQEGRIAVDWNATLLPGEIAGQKTPAIDAAGSVDERGVRGTFVLHERAIPVNISFSKEHADGDAVDFDLRLKRTILAQSPRIQALAPIFGTIEGTVSGTITSDRVLLRPALAGSSLGIGQFKLENQNLRGAVEFVPSEPENAQLNLKLTADTFIAEQLKFQKLSLAVIGPVLEPEATLTAVTARGLSLETKTRTRTDRVELSNLHATVRGDGPPILLRLDHGAYDDSHMELRGLEIESTGRLSADLRSAGHKTELRVDAENLDLARIARVLELPIDTLSGKVSMNADLKLDQKSEGTLSLKVEQGAARGITGVALSLDSRFDAGRFVGTANGSVDGVGQGNFAWDLELAGSPHSLSALSDARGVASAELSGLELATLRALIPLDPSLPKTYGRARGTLKLERPDPSALPVARATLETEGLALELSDGTRIDRTELALYADLEPNRKRLSVAAHGSDLLGALGTVSMELGLPLDEWAEKMPSGDTLLAQVTEEAPLDAVFSIPARDLSEFPLPIPAAADLRGRLTARGTARGTLSRPLFSGTVNVDELTVRESGIAKPIDLETKFQAAPAARALTAQVLLIQGRSQIASGTADLTFPSGAPDGPSWLGQAQVIFDGMPTDLIVPLAETGIRGSVQGSLAVARRDLLPELSSSLEIKKISALGKRVGDGTLEMRTNGARVGATLEIEDEFGSFEAQVDGSLRATRDFVELSPAEPLMARVTAKRFNASVLAPVFEDVLDDFGGSLSGEASLELGAPLEETDSWRAKITGHLSLTDGEMTPTSMRLKFTGVTMNLKARPEGNYNLLEVTNLRAKARSNEENFEGQGTLYFNNLDWVGGRITFSQTQVPVLFEGIELATLSGKGQLDMEKQDDELHMKLEIPELEAELPAISDRNLIALRENETIVVTTGSRNLFEKEAASGDDTKIILSVHLGDRVRVKSSFLNLKVAGDPVVYIDDDLTMDGSIALVPGGRIHVMGRVFIIEHGTVYFDNSDISNPLLELSATWRASDGVLIRAALSGRAKNPRLEWSSDPPMPGGENAVIARVLGGGSQGNASNTGLAYGAAAVNELLGQSGVRGVEFSAQTETSQQGQIARLSERSRDSYSAAVQISENVWFEGKYTQDRAGPGTTPRSGFSGTIDWRFSPQWSARTEVGTLGVGLDMLWQYRY